MSRPLYVIGLRGLIGFGKSYVARELAGHFNAAGVEAVATSVTAPLKDGLAMMGITKDAYPQQYRKFAREIGAGMRVDDPDYWVKRAMGRKPANVVIFDDIRFANEARLCDVVFYVIPSDHVERVKKFNLLEDPDVTEYYNISGYESYLGTRLDKELSIVVRNEHRPLLHEDEISAAKFIFKITMNSITNRIHEVHTAMNPEDGA